MYKCEKCKSQIKEKVPQMKIFEYELMEKGKKIKKTIKLCPICYEKMEKKNGNI